MLHVPYKGNSQAIVDVIAGQVAMMYDQISTSAPLVTAGKLRALAVTSGKRMAALPDVPTMSEAGLPGYEVTGWYGLVAPVATSRDIIARLHAQTVKALRQKDVIEKLAAQGSDAVGNTPTEFATHIRLEDEKWGKVIKSAKMRLD